jgi:hypothetical protein
MSRICKLAAASALTLVFAPPAFAHHPGAPGNSGATGPINTLSATTPEQGDISVGLSFETTSFDALSDDMLEAEAAAAASSGHAHVHSLDELSGASLSLAYGLSDDLMLSVRVPYLWRDGVRTGHFHGGVPEVENEGGSAGIGDISAMLQWRFYQSETVDIALIGGVKGPTGEDDVRNDLGDVFAAEFQPDSGSWDFTAGAAVTRRAGHWSFDASGLYTIAGENDDDDDLGDHFAYGVAASYRVIGHPPYHRHMGIGEHSHLGVDVVLELNGEWHGEQSEAGEGDPNSGGHVVFLSPGVRVVYDEVAAYLTIGAPIVSEMDGVQAEPDLRVTAGVSRRF